MNNKALGMETEIMDSDEEVFFKKKMDDKALEKEYMDSDQEDDDDEQKHAQLLDAIASIGGQHKPRLTQRTIPGSQASEFTFGTSEDAGKVNLTDLVKSLKKSTKQRRLKKQLRSVQKGNQVIATPLSKPETERLQRSIAYESTKTEVSKWQPIVIQNRKASQISFPLEQPQLELLTTNQLAKQIKPFTPLEVEVAALLKGSKNVLKLARELTRAEERALKAMSLEEAKARRAELQKYRVLMSYKETKAKRQKKIKSKKYHRILRKEREKEEKKALETLKETDPEAYLEKLQEADRNRIQERMSLKHRGGSNFARKTLMYAKFNKKDKQAVNDMIQKNRELTKKVNLDTDSDEDNEDNEEDTMEEFPTTDFEPSLVKGHNPWMSSRLRLGKLPDSETMATIEKHPVPDQTEREDQDSKKDLADIEQVDVEVTDLTVFQGDNPWMNRQSEETSAVNESFEKTDCKESDLKNASENVHMTRKDSTEINDSNTKEKESNIEQKKSKIRKKKQSAELSSEKKSGNQLEAKVEAVSKINDTSKKKRKKNLSENLSDKKKKKQTGGETSQTDVNSSQKQRKVIVKTSLEKENDSEGDEIEDIFEKLDKPKPSPSRKSKHPSKRKSSERHIEESMDEESSDDDGLSESLDRKKTLEDMDSLAKQPEVEPKKKKRKRKRKKKNSAEKQPDEEPAAVDVSVDPSRVLAAEEAVADTVVPDIVTGDGEEVDREEQQRLIIEQAFADDDVVDEFTREKSQIEDRDKPKDVDLTLPGWGEWGGAGVEPSAGKKKRFVIKAPPAPPRKDRNLGNVIISELKDSAISKYQVSQLPFPYTSMKQFEQGMRAPVGKEWNPQTAYKKLVEPKVVTQLGTIISPIDKEETFKKQRKEESRRQNSKNFKGRKL